MNHYPTLGYSSNPFMEKYSQQFLQKLQDLWRVHIGSEVPSHDFLLHPDIHGLLLEGNGFLGVNNEDVFNALRIEYISFKKRGSPYLLSLNTGRIPGTHIELTLDFKQGILSGDTHPNHKDENIGATFGVKSIGEWMTLFTHTFGILQQTSPGFMDEIDGIIRKIIPFDVSHGSHNSGSFGNFIGYIVMSYPVNIDLPEIVLLEALIHEYNHNKLNLILQTEILLYNDRREIYYSPYRPDPRHIHGIYLGLHALVGVYSVILKAYIDGNIHLTDTWLAKSVLYVLKNGLALQVLDKYAQLSPLGHIILEDMRILHKECLTFIRQAHISSDIIDDARKLLFSHFQCISNEHPDILS